MEKSLTALDFETIHIWQPSLLMGERPEKRFLEEFAGKFMHLSLWGNTQALPGKTVAKAMLQAFVQGTQAGVQIFNVADIKRFAAQSRSEERRVGKECRSRWSTADYKKNMRVMDGH